jgi:hypothetical protein
MEVSPERAKNPSQCELSTPGDAITIAGPFLEQAILVKTDSYRYD